MIDPRVKMLMKLKKEQLIYKACEFNLTFTGFEGKLQLAMMIARYEEERSAHDWQIISETAK